MEKVGGPSPQFLNDGGFMMAAISDTELARQALQPAATDYGKSVIRRLAILVALALLALCIFVIDILVGSGTLALNEVVNVLLFPGSADASARFVVWELRMPMTLMALITGISLSLSGLLMQSILDNPLAEPFTLGVSSAAGFGAALSLGFSVSITSIMPWLPPELITAVNAFLFALLAAGLVLRPVSGWRKRPVHHAAWYRSAFRLQFTAVAGAVYGKRRSAPKHRLLADGVAAACHLAKGWDFCRDLRGDATAGTLSCLVADDVAQLW